MWFMIVRKLLICSNFINIFSNSMQMSRYINYVCMELKKLTSPSRCWRALCRHRHMNTAGAALTGWRSNGLKPQHCWCRSVTQVSASKTHLAAYVMKVFFCHVYGAANAERRKVNVLEMKCFRSLVECHEWIELGMKRCVGKLE